jgi:tRNA(fMet)-specific endonuclease VapC
MKRYLLDTNICVFFLRGQYALDKRFDAVGFDNCYISEITLAELKYGAECSNKIVENRLLIAEFAKEMKILPAFECFDLRSRKSEIKKVR